MTRQEAVARRYQQLVTTCGATTSTQTLFDVYRRQVIGTGARGDLGEQVRPTAQNFAVIATAQVGRFVNKAPDEQGWKVLREGDYEGREVDLFVTYPLRPGDNVLLAADGRMYAVEDVSLFGPVFRALLDSKKAQAQHG